MNYSNHHHLSR